MDESTSTSTPPRRPADLQRRRWASALGVAMGLAYLGTAHTQPVRQARHFRVLLNTGMSGPVAFFLLAQDRGYLRDEGLELSLSAGPGAAAMVPMVRDGAFDIGYGDISALIERIAKGAPGAGPVAIFTTFNVVPFTIAVDARGPIKRPEDLIGKRVVGHASDAALLTFDLYAQAAGIDARKVQVDGSMGGMGQAVKDMLQGQGADGVFGFVNTLIASAAPLGVDPASLRFLNWSDVLPEMYGNTLFVTRETYRRDGPALQGLVRAINRGLVDTAQQPQAAIDALLRHAPGSDRGVNLRPGGHLGHRDGAPRGPAHRHRRHGRRAPSALDRQAGQSQAPA
jgi:NitT/TauT family transport system substrate-binding protein